MEKRKMILTYKIMHHRNFELELSKAWQVAKIALKTRTRSSAEVIHWSQVNDSQSDTAKICK